jgi:hypothetical protein
MANLTLIVTRGGEVKRFPVRAERPQVVGRGQDVDILVADVSISRHQFTIVHAGDSVDLEVSQGSRNQVLLNGRPVQTCKVRPGDRLSVGYCSFELAAESEIPVARAARVPRDPAGPIDEALAEEERRIAPRWMASIEDAEAEKKRKEREARERAGKQRPLTERMAVPAALVLLAGLGGFYYWKTQTGEQVSLEAPERLDLFADPPPVGCNDPEECFGRAKRSYELGLKLAEQSGADPATLFKAARQFQVASLALKGQNYRLPELQPRYEAARKKVITAFEDARLRLIRAQQEGNPSAALTAIDEQVALLQGSKHPYKDQLLRARSRVLEVRESARREALQSGGSFK